METAVDAVDRSFLPAEQEGHGDWVWAPGEASPHQGLGSGLTGAQMSMYERARGAMEAAVPVLDGLAPLRPTVDPAELGGLRTVVRHELVELVSELGMAGGPRALRVDVLFDLLLGPDSAVDPTEIGGVLGTLRDSFGLTPQVVTDMDEEQNFTNFVLVADYVSALRQRWKDARRFFDRRDDDYIGDHRVRLVRTLAVVAESVDEFRSALDSVGMGHARRAETVVDLAYESPLTLAELLDWIHRFAAEEGPALVRRRGRTGAEALASTAALLRAVVRATRPGLRALLELVADQVDQVERDLESLYQEAMIVSDEPSPAIDGISPARGAVGDQVKAEIHGSRFAAGADVRLVRTGFSSIWSSEAMVADAENITIILDLFGAAPGAWDVQVINPIGSSAVLPGGFLVLSADD
jgi:hypothetical protein